LCGRTAGRRCRGRPRWPRGRFPEILAAVRMENSQLAALQLARRTTESADSMLFDVSTGSLSIQDGCMDGAARYWLSLRNGGIPAGFVAIDAAGRRVVARPAPPDTEVPNLFRTSGGVVWTRAGRLNEGKELTLFQPVSEDGEALLFDAIPGIEDSVL